MSKSQKKWTAAEDAALVKDYSSKGAAKIALELGRSERAVTSRISILRRRQQESLHPRTIANTFESLVAPELHWRAP